MNDERISGIVADLTVIATRTGRNMVTFVVGGKRCKAFGDVAATLQALNGNRVEITGTRKSYRGQVEYSVVSITATVNGRPVTVTDTRSNAPVKAESGTCPHCGAQMVGRDLRSKVNEENIEAVSKSAFAAGITPEVQVPANNPTPNTPALSEEDRRKRDEKEVGKWVLMFSDRFHYSDKYLEKELTSSYSDAWIREAATRVLEARKAERIDWSLVAERASEGGSDASLTQRVPVVQGVIRKIISTPTTDGRKMVVFSVGPYSCMVFGKIAEFLLSNASQYYGKSVAVYGSWKINERGRKAFVHAESMPATEPDPTVAVTDDEVQKALEGALIRGSGLAAVGGPTFDEMKAEYEAAREERKRAEQQSVSSAVAVVPG